jgi:hypothetical protein
MLPAISLQFATFLFHLVNFNDRIRTLAILVAAQSHSDGLGPATSSGQKLLASDISTPSFRVGEEVV